MNSPHKDKQFISLSRDSISHSKRPRLGIVYLNLGLLLIPSVSRNTWWEFITWYEQAAGSRQAIILLSSDQYHNWDE